MMYGKDPYAKSYDNNNYDNQMMYGKIDMQRATTTTIMIIK